MTLREGTRPGGGSGRGRGPGWAIRVQPRDEDAVWFVGIHGVATMPQTKAYAFSGWDGAGRWRTVSDQAVYRRLKKLCGAGLLEHRRTWYGDHGVYRATKAGLGLAGLDLAPARLDRRDYAHDLLVVDLALRLTGCTGDGWIPERVIRGGLGVGASIGRVPDGLLLGPGGERWAVELEVSGKESQRYYEACDKYARRHRTAIPEGASGMVGMGEYADDYLRSGGLVDGVVWYFFSEKKRRRALAEAEKVLASLRRQHLPTDHLRFLFSDAHRPVPPPFEKWGQQQREAEEQRRRELEEQQRRGDEGRPGPEVQAGREPGSGGSTPAQQEELSIMHAAVVMEAAAEARDKRRHADEEEERARAEREKGEKKRRRAEAVRGWLGRR